MSGEGGSVDDKTVAEVIEGLRALLAAIDAGEVAASEVQRAYLAGAADTLDAITADRPES